MASNSRRRFGLCLSRRTSAFAIWQEGSEGFAGSASELVASKASLLSALNHCRAQGFAQDAESMKPWMDSYEGRNAECQRKYGMALAYTEGAELAALESNTVRDALEGGYLRGEEPSGQTLQMRIESSRIRSGSSGPRSLQYGDAL